MSNIPKICLFCGRTFLAQSQAQAFCCKTCKRRYANRMTFRCRDCRNASCTVRNEDLYGSPVNCPNLKWNP